jgi:flagellar hook-basal body complex protein FliE
MEGTHMRVDAASKYIQMLNQEMENENQKVDFSKMMKDYLGDVNELQVIADDSTNALITGETDNVHDVMIAAEEARLALEMTVQVRNKVIEAYQELIRMQI